MMAARSRRSRSKHDMAVRRHVELLERNGWSVQADIRGFPRPRSICGPGGCWRPDIIAKRGGKTRVIEWETPESYREDWRQHAAFRAYARDRTNTTSTVRIC